MSLLAGRRRGWLRGAAVVAMVQATHLRSGHNRAEEWWPDRPGLWRVLGQREVRPRLVVVRHVASQDAVQSGFVHHDDVIEALASYRSDHPLRTRVLPRGPRGGAEFLDSHPARGGLQSAEGVVPIANEV